MPLSRAARTCLCASAPENAPSHRRVVWSEAFRVGRAVLDAQHLDLIRQINQFCAALDAKEDMAAKHDALHMLVHAAKKHFAHEAKRLEEAAAKSPTGAIPRADRPICAALSQGPPALI